MEGRWVASDVPHFTSEIRPVNQLDRIELFLFTSSTERFGTHFFVQRSILEQQHVVACK